MTISGWSLLCEEEEVQSASCRPEKMRLARKKAEEWSVVCPTAKKNWTEASCRGGGRSKLKKCTSHMVSPLFNLVLLWARKLMGRLTIIFRFGPLCLCNRVTWLDPGLFLNHLVIPFTQTTTSQYFNFFLPKLSSLSLLLRNASQVNITQYAEVIDI